MQSVFWVSSKDRSLKLIHKSFTWPLCIVNLAQMDADIAYADYTAGVLPTYRKTDFGNVYI